MSELTLFPRDPDDRAKDTVSDSAPGTITALRPAVSSDELAELMRADIQLELEQYGPLMRVRIPIKRLLVWLACYEIFPQRLISLIWRLRHD